MTGKSPTSLIQEVIASAGVDHGTATAIATDFLALDVSKHDEPGREIEKTFTEFHKPGFDSYSFRLFLKDRYSLTDKQSSVVLKGFRYKLEAQRSINILIPIGDTDVTWTFRSSCAKKDSHQPINGEKLSLENGIALVDGSAVRPGEQWLCACDFRIVIPERKEPKVSSPNKMLKYMKNIFTKKPSQQARLTIEVRTITKSKTDDKKPT